MISRSNLRKEILGFKIKYFENKLHRKVEAINKEII